MNRREFLKYAGIATLLIAMPKAATATLLKGTRDMKQIFEPLAWNNLKLKNRLLRSATWEGIAAPNGAISDKAYEFCKQAKGKGVKVIELAER